MTDDEILALAEDLYRNQGWTPKQEDWVEERRKCACVLGAAVIAKCKNPRAFKAVQ